MRMTRLFSHTLRDVPADADIPSHQLLLRAGFIRQHAAGIFSYLPLARRSLTKIENIMRREMDRIGGQEITMPIINPADLWKETGRWYQVGPELGRFKDRAGRDMAIAMTHEEVVSDLIRKEVRSYKQMPLLIYHLQTKWRDEPRPRAGLIRVREFTMKDSYSIDVDWEGLDRQYRAHYQAYFNIFNRCGLPTIAVQSDVGMMGGTGAHEYMYLTAHGEDTLLLCDHCGYSANRQIARFRREDVPAEAPAELEKVSTPQVKTIDALSEFLGVPKAKTAKAVFLVALIPEEHELVERFVFAVVRGDMDLNETKLGNVLKAQELRPATEEEIRGAGAVPGYASPLSLEGVLVVVDEAIPVSHNLVAGANEEGFHLLNVNYGRDFKASLITDLVSAGPGSSCPLCGQPLRSERGVEVGNIFKLGTRYSEAMDCNFLDQNGQEQPLIMGSYGIGSGRLLACIADEHHDNYGLIWPVSVAPYHVHLVVLAGKTSQPEKASLAFQTAERLYNDLTAAGVEILFDDRNESPGIKFNDADLIGLPIRLTVSERALSQGGVEYKRRDKAEKSILPIEQVLFSVQAELHSLKADIEKNVVNVEMKA
jgi:prolyl-tRNA synthetase